MSKASHVPKPQQVERASIPIMQVVPSHGPTDQLLEPSFPYGEELLQFIWEQGLYEKQGLRTTDGRPVEVLDAGRIQGNSGPDLDGAKLRIAEQLWAGTVEVHLRSSAWNSHGHQFDPAYENVVLHVVHSHDAEVRTLRGHILPTVELRTRISVESIALHLELMRSQNKVACAKHIHRAEAMRTSAWLERLLVERLERKTADVETLFAQLDKDPASTLYHLFARAFGMQVNAEPFGMLAHALPLKLLLKYRDDPQRMEALLFGQAGLLQVDFVDEHPRRLQQEHVALADMHGLRPAPLAAWKFGRMRPVNFPTLRIAQLVQLLMRCDGSFSDLLEEDDVAVIRERLAVQAGPYWDTHYVFDKESAALPKRLGVAACDHLIINALVPGLFAMGRATGRTAWEDRALSLLEQLPAEKNSLLRAWAELGLVADNAARGQALIELKNNYCDPRRCLSCGIGNQLYRCTVK